MCYNDCPLLPQADLEIFRVPRRRDHLPHHLSRVVSLGCLVAVLHVQAGIVSSTFPLHVASNPSVVQPGLPYWLETGLQGEESGSFPPSCGLSSLRTPLLLRAQDDQLTQGAEVRPHPHDGQGGRTRGWRVWRLALVGSLHSTWRCHALRHWGWWEVER